MMRPEDGNNGLPEISEYSNVSEEYSKVSEETVRSITSLSEYNFVTEWFE